MNINNFSPRPGRLIREDGSVVNLADCITDDGKLRVEGLGGGGGGPVNWDDIQGKPDEYKPEEHTHPIAQVEGLQDALDGKLSEIKVEGIEPIEDPSTATTEDIANAFNALLNALKS